MRRIGSMIVALPRKAVAYVTFRSRYASTVITKVLDYLGVIEPMPSA